MASNYFPRLPSAEESDTRPRTIQERVERKGLPRRPLKDLYHWLLVSSWTRLYVLFVLSYVGINLLFATGYYLDRGGVENSDPNSFSDAFFFSVQTMATIGYGKMVPHSVFAHTLVTIEALVGMLGTAIAAGLMFAKFSRPTARVIFSRNMVISKRDGVPCLILRLANERGNQVVEAQLHLVYLKHDRTSEGEHIRRAIDLKLARDRTAIFALTWTAYHPITPDSPLFGETVESLVQSRAEFFATIIGLDDTFSQTVQARYSYFADEIAADARFVDILTRHDDGSSEIDYTKFHEIEPSL